MSRSKRTIKTLHERAREAYGMMATVIFSILSVIALAIILIVWLIKSL